MLVTPNVKTIIRVTRNNIIANNVYKNRSKRHEVLTL